MARARNNPVARAQYVQVDSFRTRRESKGEHLTIGVGDGIRTRNVQIHSLALYQLSYTHRDGSAVICL